jgi:hypothetical protein
LTDCVVQDVENAPGQAVGIAESTVATAQQQAEAAITQAEGIAGGAVGTVEQELGQVGQTIAPYVTAAEQEVATVQSQVQSLLTQAEAKAIKNRSVICVLQGRAFASSGQANGSADCFVYENSNPTDAFGEGAQTGTFSFPTNLTPDPIGKFLGAGTITAGGRTYSVNLGGWPSGGFQTNTWEYTGTWTDTDGTSHPASGDVQDTPASTVDPNGGSDQFLDGVVVLTP